VATEEGVPNWLGMHAQEYHLQLVIDATVAAMVRLTPAAAISERGTIAGEMVVTILMALATRSGVGEAREGLGRSKAAVVGSCRCRRRC